jgi:hypothetical protein
MSDYGPWDWRYQLAAGFLYFSLLDEATKLLRVCDRILAALSAAIAFWRCMTSSSRMRRGR